MDRRGKICGALAILLMIASSAQAIQRRSASASPTPTPDPNLAALTGLGGIGALQGGVGSNGGNGGNGNGGTCSNQDLLTNLLVYQYLSGSIPNGGGPPGSDPRLHALLGSAGPATTTVTSVSTTLTTLVVDVEPTTQFMTSTTSYVTTLTSVETKVIPVLFRGSKITTTISESSEEVITATEYFTESSVHSPTIVQTLPVHITMTATSTRGLNGRYTLFSLTPGPSSVVHQPVSTATLDLDAAGLDLGNLDFSQLDLTSLTSGGFNLPNGDADNNQMLSVLSSLLQHYDDTGDLADDYDTFPSNGGTRFGGGVATGRSGDGRRQQSNFRRTRFEDTFQSDYADYDAPIDEAPKFNVLSGFTLSDRVASSGSSSSSNSGSGRAATDTRYSKYHRKDSRVVNNGITAPDTNTRDRETERFSASNRRRTFTRTSNDQRRSKEERTTRAPSTRFVPAAESQYFEDSPPKFRPFGTRSDREVTSRRRAGLVDDEQSPAQRSAPRPTSAPRLASAPRPKLPNRNDIPAAPTPPENVRTTVLTMYSSGTVPGEFYTSLRTVTLRSLATRRRRDAPGDSATTKIIPTETATLRVTDNSLLPEIPGSISPKEIVHLLKSLDSTQVKQMLKSLQKWVDYYSHEVLDERENIGQDVTNKSIRDIAPELTSSLNMENTEVETKATMELPLSPSSVSGTPSSSNLCYPPPTVTETVYHTFIITSGISAA